MGTVRERESGGGVNPRRGARVEWTHAEVPGWSGSTPTCQGEVNPRRGASVEWTHAEVPVPPVLRGRAGKAAIALERPGDRMLDINSCLLCSGLAGKAPGQRQVTEFCVWHGSWRVVLWEISVLHLKASFQVYSYITLFK